MIIYIGVGCIYIYMMINEAKECNLDTFKIKSSIFYWFYAFVGKHEYCGPTVLSTSLVFVSIKDKTCDYNYSKNISCLW